MKLTVIKSGGSVPAGAYQSVFSGVESVENEYGKGYRWTFQTDDGKQIVGFSDRERPPTTGNKTGRWLAALSGKPLSDGLDVDTDAYVGKRYMVIVQDTGEGKTRLETFSLIG